jgi:hypothetical protein
MAAEVRGDRQIVHLCETFIHTDVTQVAIKVAESDGNAIVNSIKLGKTLGGESFKAERKGGIRSRRLGFGGVGWGRRVHSFCENFGELLGWDWAAVEPALSDIAAKPEEHVGDGLVFDAFGDGSKHEAVAKAHDSRGDFSALPCVCHGTDEAGVNLEFVEGKELEVTEAGVAGSEVVEREAGTLLL